MKTEFPATLPEIGFIRLPHFLYLLGGLSKSTFWDGVKTGRFPRPVKIADRASGWPVAVVRKTLAEIEAGQQ